MHTGLIEEKELCEKLTGSRENRIILWQSEKGKPSITHVIEGSDTKKMLENILEILPNPDILDEQKFRVSKKY